MRFFITMDADKSSGIEAILDDFYIDGFKKWFESREYSADLKGITIVLMCQPDKLNLKKRVKYSKVDKKLYSDILLSLKEFKKKSHSERKSIIKQSLIDEISFLIEKHKIPDLRKEDLKQDLDEWFNNNNW